MPEEELQIRDKRIIGWISADDSAGNLMQSLVGLCVQAENDDIYNRVVKSYPNIRKMALQYVPDDIICYSDLTVEQFLHGIAMAQAEPDKAETESLRLTQLFDINREEELLNMTFEQNRLVAMIQSLIAEPEMLLLNQPHDMIGEKRYHQLLTEFARFYKQGGHIMIAAHAYEEIYFPCEEYIYLRSGEVVADFLRNQLIKPAKMITMTGGNLAWMVQDKMTILQEKANQVQFIYRETNMQELAVRLCKTGCKDFVVEDITREELIFENFERWS